jgi:serine/threonine-protein kinase
MEQLGEFLGRYQLVRVLGRGAMGVVYEGLDPKLNRQVAVKTILKSQMLDQQLAAEYSARFIREAQAVARLNHPNIVTVFDFGSEAEVAYLVMEFIRGKELKTYLDAKHLFGIAEAVAIVCDLLEALDYAHNNGIIHRDIKPANVMLDGGGRVKLTDFGVARLSEGGGQDGTRAGTMVGTPSYMSPEQIKGLPAGAGADLFATGVLLYQCLSLQKPFIGTSEWDIWQKIVNEDPPPLSTYRDMVPAALERAVLRALAKDPKHRHPSARALIADLKAAVAGESFDADATRLVLGRSPPAGAGGGHNGSIAPSRAGTTVSVADTTTHTRLQQTSFSPNHEIELEFWRSIKESGDVEEFQLYLERFPTGSYSDLARRKMSKLTGATTAVRTDTTGTENSAPADAGAALRLEQLQAQARMQAEAEQERKRRADEAERAAAAQAAQRATEAALALAEEARRQEAARVEQEAAQRSIREAQRKAADEAEQEARRTAAIEAENAARRTAAAVAEKEAQRKAEKEAQRQAAEAAEQESQRKAAEAAQKESQRKAAEAAAQEAQRKAREAAEKDALKAAEKQAKQREAEAAEQAAQRKAAEAAEKDAQRKAAEAAEKEAQRRSVEAAEEETQRQAGRDAAAAEAEAFNSDLTIAVIGEASPRRAGERGIHVEPQVPAKSKAPLFIGGAVAAAILIGGGVMMVSKTDSPPPPAVARSSSAPPVNQPPAPPVNQPLAPPVNLQSVPPAPPSPSQADTRVAVSPPTRESSRTQASAPQTIDPKASPARNARDEERPVADKLNANNDKAEKVARERAEKERERLAAQESEAERAAAAKREQQRIAAEKTEADRIEAQRKLAERIAAEKEAERLAAIEKDKALVAEQRNQDARNPDALFAKAQASESEGKMAEAVRTYQLAYTAGSGQAARKLGDLYAGKSGIGRDYGKQQQWYRKAAEKGIAIPADSGHPGGR